MNHREQIDAIMKQVHPPLASDVDKLEALLGVTQNGPPYGARDESINANLWYALRRTIRAARELENALNDWEAAVEGSRPPPESA